MEDLKEILLELATVRSDLAVTRAALEPLAKIIRGNGSGHGLATTVALLGQEVSQLTGVVGRLDQAVRKLDLLEAGVSDLQSQLQARQAGSWQLWAACIAAGLALVGQIGSAILSQIKWR